MIGFAFDLVVEHVVKPQQDEARGELRAYYDPDAQPLDVHAQEIDARATTSRIVGYEIGGGLTVRHEIVVGINVGHGDPVEARRLRDLIVLDVVRRLFAAEAIAQAVDGETGQYVAAVDLGPVDYSPLGTASDTNESALLTVLIDVQIDG